jgi:hypothetical protein
MQSYPVLIILFAGAMKFNQDLHPPLSAEAGSHKPPSILIPAIAYQLTEARKDAVAAQKRLRGTKVFRPVNDLYRARRVRLNAGTGMGCTYRLSPLINATPIHLPLKALDLHARHWLDP